MAITYDIYTDGLYLEGKEDGVQLGIDKVIRVRQLLNDGLGEKEISNQTQLPLKTVRKIIAAG